MLIRPSQSEYAALRSMAASGISFDGADQGLLNEYYSHHPWHRLSFTYNCTPSGSYQYEPAYRHFKNDIKMVHFIGKEKPWMRGRQAMYNEQSSVYKELLGRWWAVYDKHYTAIVSIGETVQTYKTIAHLLFAATISLTATRSSSWIYETIRYRRARTECVQLGCIWTFSTSGFCPSISTSTCTNTRTGTC